MRVNEGTDTGLYREGKETSILQQRNDCSRMERRRPAASDVAGGHDLGRRAHGYGRAAGFSGVDALSSCIGGGRVRHRDPILCPDAPYLGEGQSSERVPSPVGPWSSRISRDNDRAAMVWRGLGRRRFAGAAAEALPEGGASTDPRPARCPLGHVSPRLPPPPLASLKTLAALLADFACFGLALRRQHLL